MLNYFCYFLFICLILIFQIIFIIFFVINIFKQKIYIILVLYNMSYDKGLYANFFKKIDDKDLNKYSKKPSLSDLSEVSIKNIFKDINDKNIKNHNKNIQSNKNEINYQYNNVFIDKRLIIEKKKPKIINIKKRKKKILSDDEILNKIPFLNFHFKEELNKKKKNVNNNNNNIKPINFGSMLFYDLEDNKMNKNNINKMDYNKFYLKNFSNFKISKSNIPIETQYVKKGKKIYSYYDKRSSLKKNINFDNEKNNDKNNDKNNENKLDFNYFDYLNEINYKKESTKSFRNNYKKFKKMKSKLDIKMLKDNKEIFSELKNDSDNNNNSDEKNENDDNFKITSTKEIFKKVNEYNQLSEKKLPIRVFSANFKNKNNFSPIQKNFSLYKNNYINNNKKSRNIISSFSSHSNSNTNYNKNNNKTTFRNNSIEININKKLQRIKTIQNKMKKKLFSIIDNAHYKKKEKGLDKVLEIILNKKLKKRKNNHKIKNLYYKAFNEKDAVLSLGEKKGIIKVSDILSRLTDEEALKLSERIIENYKRKRKKLKIDFAEDVIEKKMTKEEVKKARENLYNNINKIEGLLYQTQKEKNHLIDIYDKVINNNYDNYYY